MSEKPTAILEHFFRMIVDETTVMVDPTCGSGNSVKVAEALGASWSLGMDMNPDYVDAAKENLELD
jgi:DNA modification methylase